MKYTFIFLGFVLLSLVSCKSDTPQTIAPSEVETIKEESYKLLDSDPEKAVVNYKNLAHHFLITSNKEELGKTQLYIANIYDEYLNELDSALYYSEKSFNTWKHFGDEIQQANLLKYLGLLRARKGDIMVGIKNVNQSKAIYNRLKSPQGVASADFKLAQVFFEEKNYDQSLILFDYATKFWIANGDNNHVFSNNLFGIKLHLAMDNAIEAKKLIDANESMKSSIQMNAFLENKFDKMKALYQEKVNNETVMD